LRLHVINLQEDPAKQLLEVSDYYLSARVSKACVDALAALFGPVGAASRITEPTSPTDGPVIRANLWHFVLVTTMIRNVVKLAACT